MSLILILTLTPTPPFQMCMTVFYYCAFYFVTYIVIEALAILWRTPYLQATDDEDACSVCFALYLLAHQLVELVVVVGIGHTCRAGSPLFTRRPVQAPDVGAAAEADFVLAGERRFNVGAGWYDDVIYARGLKPLSFELSRP